MELNIILSIFAEIRLFGIKIIDTVDFFELIVRYFFNFLVVLIIVQYFYYPNRKRRDYYFTYIIISTTVFFLCFLLNNVKLQLGFALGLFAIFGIIRYRTSQIPIKEMTYLFLIIGITVVNSLANKKVSYMELVASNAIVIGVLAVFEKLLFVKTEVRKTIIYEKIELIKPENRALLIKDLEERTGLKINHLEIRRIDFMRDIARIRIYYFEKPEPLNGKNKENKRITGV